MSLCFLFVTTRLDHQMVRIAGSCVYRLGQFGMDMGIFQNRGSSNRLVSCGLVASFFNRRRIPDMLHMFL